MADDQNRDQEAAPVAASPADAVDNPAMEAMASQVEMAWQMMLAQATAAGFTREDIISLTLDTAAVILEATRNALWPGVETPATETYARYAYMAHVGDLRNDAVNWQDRTPPEDH